MHTNFIPILNIIINVKKGFDEDCHAFVHGMVELSFPIKRQELSKKLRIKEDSKTALRKKRRSAKN